MARITKRTVDALEARGADCIVFDDEVKGFGVRVLASGQKTYLVQYRSGGRTRRVKIGRHGVLTADEARKKAKELLGTVAKGDNPAHDISAYRRSPTVNAVCERFIREHIRERCKPSTQHEYERVLNVYVKSKFGAFKIGDVTRADISQLQHDFRESPYQANRVLAVLSKLFNLCEVWGLRPDGSNPCRHVAKYQERKRDRFLSDTELASLGKVLACAQRDETETLHTIAAFQLLILTGCRLSEIQKLKWEYVKNGYLLLPDSKTGARRIPLAPEAQIVLENLPRVPKNEYVIAAADGVGYIRNLHHAWRRLQKLAGLERVRIHDLRHTYASNAVMQGHSIVMVAKLLGHSQIQTTMRYAHLADDPIREAATQVASVLGKSLSAKPQRASIGGSVLQFPKRS
jgi:integrase